MCCLFPFPWGCILPHSSALQRQNPSVQGEASCVCLCSNWDGAALQHVLFLKPPIVLASHQHQSWLCSGSPHGTYSREVAPLCCSPHPLVGMEPHALSTSPLEANDTWGTTAPCLGRTRWPRPGHISGMATWDHVTKISKNEPLQQP